jgi:molybdenum cofactor cytidylyltransferase
MSVAAIVLAAGRSTRMGMNKMLADIGGKSLIGRTVDAVLASRARPVVLVTGHEPEKLAESVAGRDIVVVRNPRYDEGLSTSLIAGIAALPKRARAALICLGDMPLVAATTLDMMVDSFESEPGLGAVVPACGGEWGNPVLISRKLFALVATLHGDTGARKLLQARADVKVIEVGDPAILVDADTPASLREMRRWIDDPPTAES